MKLRIWRESRNLTRVEMGDLVGTTSEAIRLYERGDRIPHKDIMVRLWEISDGAVMPNDFYEAYTDTAA